MRLARVAADGRWVLVDDAASWPLPEGTTLGGLLALDAATFRTVLTAAAAGPPAGPAPTALLAPVDPDTEVWAAGVTYEVSRSARIEESREATLYERVYAAERPELFFKAIGWRVAGDGAPVGIRDDSTWDVPEPELAVVANAHGEIVAYTICDDVSSRSIEGDNSLYLPQAKMYRGSCALGPTLVPAWEVPDARRLGITVEIRRDGGLVWAGATSTAFLRRSPEELVRFLYRGEVFPRGVVLSTGTSAVPGADVTLRHGDDVAIAVDGLGALANRVVAGARHAAWGRTGA